MNVFRAVCKVQASDGQGFVQELSWDGKDAAMLVSEGMGMRTETELTADQARRDVRQWMNMFDCGEIQFLERDLEVATELLGIAP